MSDEFHRRLTGFSTEWAEADRDAHEAEAHAKQVFARIYLIKRETSKSQEDAKQMVEACDEYCEARQVAIEARYRANLAKRAINDAETAFSRWQTLQANERFTARAAT